MVFDANIDATGDRTDHSNHHTEVSLVSLHNKSIFGTLGIVAVILGIAIAVWIFHRKRITKHRRRHAALLAITYSPEEKTLRHAEGGEARPKHQQQRPHGQSSHLGCPPSP
jgi:flagellar biosynthesis/type III secretory pathway M-ring protein FliF/YscJ